MSAGTSIGVRAHTIPELCKVEFDQLCKTGNLDVGLCSRGLAECVNREFAVLSH